ncbi:hypothetical protein Tco_1159261, partial [Tanacetum coccineum]
MTPGYISSGLVQNLVSSTPYVPPSKKDYEILFQPLFDEYFNPPPRVVSLDPVAVAAQELLIQSVQLRQLPLIKMYHLLVLHQQIRKFNLKSFFKVHVPMIPPEPEGSTQGQSTKHPSDTKVLTMKMEILLEPTSNKLLVVGFNPLVHSFRALSTLRRSGLRTASAAAKPCQGDSSEFYLITGSIYTDKRGTVVLETLFNEINQQEQEATVSTHTPKPPRRFKFIYDDNEDDDDDDDDEESTIPLNEIISQIPPSIAITPVLPTMEPEDSLIMGDENLSTTLEKELDKVIKSSVGDFVPIPSKSGDTSESDSECDLPSCDDFYSIDVPRGNSMTLSNPFFNENDDFTSSDDKSLPEEDLPKKNFKIYSNPLFEFDDEYISSDVNPLYNEVLEDIENKDSYVSNLDEPAYLVTTLFYA